MSFLYTRVFLQPRKKYSKYFKIEHWSQNQLIINGQKLVSTKNLQNIARTKKDIRLNEKKIRI